MYFDARTKIGTCNTFSGCTPVSDLNLRRLRESRAASVLTPGELGTVGSCGRSFRNLQGINSPRRKLSSRRYVVVIGSCDRSLLRVPEHRFTLDASAEGGSAGRSRRISERGTARGLLDAHWLPRASATITKCVREFAPAPRSAMCRWTNFSTCRRARNDLCCWARGHFRRRKARAARTPLFLANWK